MIRVEQISNRERLDEAFICLLTWLYKGRKISARDHRNLIHIDEIHCRRNELKKGKNLLIFSKKGNEIRTRDRSTAIGGWPLPLSKRNSFLRGIAKLYYYAFQRERENLCFSFINNCDFFYRSIRWNSGL